VSSLLLLSEVSGLRGSLLFLSGYSSIHVPSSGETVVTLSIFTDSKLSAPLKNSTAPVGLPLYVVLKSTNNDPDRFVLVANEIFASTNDSNAEANDSTYHFVKER
jgi:hypothetical protein